MFKIIIYIIYTIYIIIIYIKEQNYIKTSKPLKLLILYVYEYIAVAYICNVCAKVNNNNNVIINPAMPVQLMIMM